MQKTFRANLYGGRRHSSDNKVTVRFCKLKDRKDAGEYDTRTKVIRVDENLESNETLRVLLHEMLHHVLPHLDEEWVDKVSKEMSSILIKVGYTNANKS